MPQDSSSPVTNRQSNPHIAPLQQPIGPSVEAVDTTLGQPSVAQPGPSRARAPEGLALHPQPARRTLSSTPAGPLRGAGNTERGIKSLDREIGRTLSALTRAKSPLAVVSALKSLERAQATAEAQGAAPRLVDERIERGIARLGPKELARLHRGLSSETVVSAHASLMEDPPTARLLATLDHLVSAKTGDGALRAVHVELGGALRRALRTSDKRDLAVSTAPARFTGVFQRAEQALGQLVEQGVLLLSPRQRCERADEAVLNAIADLGKDASAALAGMSSADLHRLAAAAQRLQPHALETRLALVIAERTEKLVDGARDAFKTFLSQPPSPDDLLSRDGQPPRIDAVLASLQALEAHAPPGGAQAPESISARLTQARKHFAASLAATSDHLNAASSTELRRIDDVARRLGVVDEDMLRPLRTAADNRYDRLRHQCSLTLEATLAGLRDGDPAATLHHLARLDALAHELVGARVVTDRRPFVGDGAAVADDEFGQFLRHVSPELLKAAAAQLQGEFGSDLLATLHDASADEGAPLEAVSRLTLVASRLEQLPEQIAQALASKQSDESTHPGIFEKHLAEIPSSTDAERSLSMSMRVAVRQEMGVDARERGDGVRAGVVNNVFKQRVDEELAMPVNIKETALVQLPSGLQVSQGFVDDAQRHFDFRLPDGSPLIDYATSREEWKALTPDEVMRRIDEGAQKLLEFYGGDKEAVTLATRRASQGLVAPLHLAAWQASLPGQPTQGNPGQLPNGRPGYPFSKHWSSIQSTSVTFLRGADGHPQLLLDYRHRGGALESTDGMPMDDSREGGSTSIYLDPETSFVRVRAHVAYHGSEGELHLMGVPTYEARIVPHAFQKVFPPPTMQTLYGKDTIHQSEARLQLGVHAAARGHRGVVPAVSAIDEFRAHPTLETAQAVAAANGPQANPGPKVSAARGVIEQVTRERAPALVACFDPARRELRAMIKERYPHDRIALRAWPDWPHGIEPPESYEALLGSGSEAINAYNEFLRADRCSEFVEFNEALEVFSKLPDVAGARALYERWVKPEPTGLMNFDGPPQQVRLNLTAATARAVLEAIERVADAPLDDKLFDEARDELGALIDSNLAPAFTADVIAGRT
jgi:hypothetical protein